MAALLGVDSDFGFIFKSLPFFWRQTLGKNANRITADQLPMVHVCPVRNFIGINRNPVSEFQPFNFRGMIIYNAVKAVAAERDVGEPQVLDFATLNKRLLDLEIGLAFRRPFERRDEKAHVSAGLFDCASHLRVFILYSEHLRLTAGAADFPRQRMFDPLACASRNRQGSYQ